MNAIPLPIRKPTFGHTVGLTCEEWIADNLDALWAWWGECEGEANDLVGFKDFAAVQFDLECDRDELLREALAESQREDEAYEDYRGREIDAELDGEEA